MLPLHGLGRALTSAGATRMMPTKAAMAPAGGVAYHGADPEREQPQQGEEDTAAQHGPQFTGCAQRDADPLAGKNCLAAQERGQAGGGSHRQGHAGEGDCLRSEDGAALGHRRERGADHAGRILGGDDQGTQHPNGQLLEEEAGQAAEKAARSMGENWLQRLTVVKEIKAPMATMAPPAPAGSSRWSARTAA